MNMSDRDKKLILLMLIICVIVLPYVFYAKDTRQDTEIQKATNESLRERLAQLEEMNQNRDFYLAEIDRYHEERDKIIASYPADIKPENFTMFLLNTERSSFKKDEESGVMYREFPFLFNSVAFGANDEFQISAEGAEETYWGVTNSSTVSFGTGTTLVLYEGEDHYEPYNNSYATMKYLLQYLLDYEDPMTYSQLSMQVEEGLITGSMTINQYAVKGEDRVLPDVEIDPDLDLNDLRGNEEDGIFGPLLLEPLEDRVDEEVEITNPEEISAENAEPEAPAAN
ncbi:MAG: hypothetical protein IKO10_05675 [Lachnospiraceae bacterium]|nr:hypothetical protein [Lachnospiraceae bacterium]